MTKIIIALINATIVLCIIFDVWCFSSGVLSLGFLKVTINNIRDIETIIIAAVQ
jgi:hypothetical protein